MVGSKFFFCFIFFYVQLVRLDYDDIHSYAESGFLLEEVTLVVGDDRE